MGGTDSSAIGVPEAQEDLPMLLAGVTARIAELSGSPANWIEKLGMTGLLAGADRPYHIESSVESRRVAENFMFGRTGAKMATPQDKLQKRRTWLPILLGVLCGIIACRLRHELFERLIARMLNGPFPGRIGDPSLHLTLFMLTMAAVGGSIGALFSRQRK